MSIAIIGWGSLVWDPRDLDIEPEWYPDGPQIPVEFARVSGGDRLTLVIVESAPPQPTLWARSRKSSVAAAAKDLAEREGLTSDRGVGAWPDFEGRDPRAGPTAEIVGRWARAHGITGAVWTMLGPKAPDGRYRLATGDEFIGYLAQLESEGKAAEARRYVENAPTQIQTPLRERIRNELGWR